MPSRRFLYRDGIFLFCLPLGLIFVFCMIIVRHETIAPVDIYTVSPELYQPGNAARVKNSFITDMVQIYLPWKYYLSEYHPQTCHLDIKNLLGVKRLAGVRLPQGSCYPLMASRAYTVHDAFFVFKKFSPFFTSYDLSYLFLLLSIYASFVFFFFEFLAGDSLVAILMATICATSFPVARDLQSDGFSQSLPFLLFSLVFFSLWLKRQNLTYILFSFVSLWGATIHTSLQGLAFGPLFWVLFNFVWWREKLNLSRLRLIAAGLMITVCSAFWYHWQAIQLFLFSVERYLPQKGVPLALQVVKKMAGLGLSWVNFFLGDLIFSFSTVDLSKVVKNLGAREYFSYDGHSFFMAPLMAVGLLSFFIERFSSAQNARAPVMEVTPEDSRVSLKVFKIINLVVLIDILVLLLPTYRFVYFRFHQWWMIINLGLVFGLLIESTTFTFTFISNKRLLQSIFIIVATSLLAALVVVICKPRLLGALINHGYLGFEDGFWQRRVDKLILRLTFQDFYGSVFLATLIFSAFLLKRQAYGGLTILATVTGLMLNIFFYNEPQSRAPFYTYLEALQNEASAKATRAEAAPRAGRVQPSNVNLLVNRPTYYIYESLEFQIEPASL